MEWLTPPKVYGYILGLVIAGAGIALAHHCFHMYD